MHPKSAFCLRICALRCRSGMIPSKAKMQVAKKVGHLETSSTIWIAVGSGSGRQTSLIVAKIHRPFAIHSSTFMGKQWLRGLGFSIPLRKKDEMMNVKNY